MDQYRQTGPLDAEFQKREDRYESLLKSQGGQPPALKLKRFQSTRLP